MPGKVSWARPDSPDLSFRGVEELCMLRVAKVGNRATLIKSPRRDFH